MPGGGAGAVAVSIITTSSGGAVAVAMIATSGTERVWLRGLGLTRCECVYALDGCCGGRGPRVTLTAWQESKADAPV